MTLLNIDAPAPPFTLLDAHEKPVNLGDFIGKWVVIYFYPKALTPGCTTQACDLRDGMDELLKHDVVVLGISPDAPRLLSKFIEKERLNFILLSDIDHKIADAYGTWQEKSMYGKTYMGMARVTYLVSPTGRVAHVWPKVTPATHLQELLTWLRHHAHE